MPTPTMRLRPIKFALMALEVTGELENGYLVIPRKWRKGDVVDIAFDMPVRTVKANDKVADDRGRIARRARSIGILCRMA